MRSIAVLVSVSAASLITGAAAGGPRLMKASPLADTNLMSNDSGAAVRRLEDGSGSYGKNVEFGRCHRVKYHQNTDDDGGQNFYNGKYHALTVGYASYFLCGSNDSSKGYCGDCDYSVEYVMPLNDYVDANVNYLDNFCGTCTANCRRRAEDKDEEEDKNDEYDDGNYNGNYADCSTCESTCANYSGGDEVNYLDCQAAYVDSDGNQLYSGPTCDSSTGDIVIDMFYDDACMIKHSVGNYYGFDYSTFSAIQKTCVDCSSSDGMCGDMYDESYFCSGGQNINNDVQEDDGFKVCKSFKTAAKVAHYSGKKKANPIIAFFLFAVMVTGTVFFGSYTYFVRHKNSKIPLASLDHGDGTSMAQEGAFA